MATILITTLVFMTMQQKKIKKMAKKRHSLAPIEFKNKKIGMKMKNQE